MPRARSWVGGRARSDARSNAGYRSSRNGAGLGRRPGGRAGGAVRPLPPRTALAESFGDAFAGPPQRLPRRPRAYPWGAFDTARCARDAFGRLLHDDCTPGAPVGPLGLADRARFRAGRRRPHRRNTGAPPCPGPADRSGHDRADQARDRPGRPRPAGGRRTRPADGTDRRARPTRTSTPTSPCWHCSATCSCGAPAHGGAVTRRIRRSPPLSRPGTPSYATAPGPVPSSTASRRSCSARTPGGGARARLLPCWRRPGTTCPAATRKCRTCSSPRPRLPRPTAGRNGSARSSRPPSACWTIWAPTWPAPTPLIRILLTATSCWRASRTVWSGCCVG